MQYTELLESIVDRHQAPLSVRSVHLDAPLLPDTENCLCQVTSPSGQNRHNANMAKLEADIHQLETVLRQIEHQKRARLHEQVEVGLQYLDAQARRINLLSACLETEILRFQKAVQEVDQDYNRLKHGADQDPASSNGEKKPRSLPNSLWHVQPVSVPTITKRRQQYSFFNRFIKHRAIQIEET